VTGLIPDKLYFRIGEAAALAKVKPSVLRFWETQFSELRPQKSSSGQRLYSREQVALVLAIRQLLYEERLTIAGTQQRLLSERMETPEHPARQSQPQPREASLILLRQIKHELEQLHKLLNS
jgi:DNA-binding transcriptional MerR regulator